MPSPVSVLRATPVRSRLAFVAIALVFAAATLVVRSPAPAVAAGAATAGSTTPASLVAPVTPLAVRGGGGFRSRPRARTNRPVARRNPNTGRALRNFSRGLLQALGIAFLLSLLFGIGPGGSPLGLLLLLGIIALIVVARRRRRQHANYGYR